MDPLLHTLYVAMSGPIHKGLEVQTCGRPHPKSMIPITILASSP